MSARPGLAQASRDWCRDAACSPLDASLFTSDTKPSTWDITRLSAICAGCPVQRDCAAYAVRNRESGYWAGVWVYPKGSPRLSALAALRRKAGVSA